jgi:hypothetical protein
MRDVPAEYKGPASMEGLPALDGGRQAGACAPEWRPIFKPAIPGLSALHPWKCDPRPFFRPKGSPSPLAAAM